MAGLGERILDLVYPRRCELCMEPAGPIARQICSKCLAKIPFAEIDTCSPDKFDRHVAFDAGAAALVFEGVARRMIIDFKFNAHLWLCEDFATWMRIAAANRFDTDYVDAVVPMPSSLFHRADRGYNQSALLARSVAKKIDRRFLDGVVHRKNRVRRQSGLGNEERWENARDSFIVAGKELVEGRTILLVDDIVTTGATLSECAKALKEAGAWRVWGLVLARRLPGSIAE